MGLVSRLKQFFTSRQEGQESKLVHQAQLQPQPQKNILEQVQGHLSDLADSGHTFWKFSQSEKGKGAESVYARYIPGCQIRSNWHIPLHMNVTKTFLRPTC